MPASRARSGGDQRTLSEWLRVLRDGAWALVAFLALGTAIGLLATKLQPTRYQTDGTVVVSPARGFLDTQGADALPALTDTVTRLVKSPAVLAPTAQLFAASAPTPQLRLIRSREATQSWLESHLSAAQVAASSVLIISAVTPQRGEARALATAAVAALTNVIDNRPGTPRNQGTVVRGFQTADKGKVSPTPTRNLLLGANAGLLLGVVAALMLGLSRRRVRGPDATAAELGVPLLGRVRVSRRGRRIGDAGVAAVRARLQLGDHSQRGTVYLLTGAVGPERMAQVGEALARSFAGSRRVLLVDADLSSRSASQLLGVADHPGLGELLKDQGSQALRNPGFLAGLLADATPGPGNARLTVLPAGDRLADAAAALSGSGLEEAFATFRRDFDVVIVVAPDVDRQGEVIPLLAAADRAVLLAPPDLPARRLQGAREVAEALSDHVAGALIVHAG